MNASPLAYCSHCQESVKPLKGIVIYRCPECGSPFFGYPDSVKTDPPEQPQPLEEAAELALV